MTTVQYLLRRLRAKAGRGLCGRSAELVPVFVASAQGAIVGICGLNRDPYVDDRSVGRLRHLYVHPNHRRAGLATALVERCLSDASGTFRRVRLRTSNPAADTLYRALGFEVVQESSATHVWWLQPPVSSGSTQGG